MATEPAPDRIEVEIPVAAESAMTFSPAPSQSRAPHRRSSATTETTPLIAPKENERKPFYRPRPLWIVPFALLSSIARGMTLAPRVQVYTQLSCNALHYNYNHTRHPMQELLFPAAAPAFLHTLGSGSLIASYEQGHNMPLPIILPEMPSSHPLGSPVRDPSTVCATDPAVQAGAARLQTAFMTTTGILSALTASWWGFLSERYGRTKILAASSFGLLVTDIAFLMSVQPSYSGLNVNQYISPHILLLIAPFIEGFLGGFTTLTAATSAYISDCTSDGSRAAIFSRFAGVSYSGFAVGPILGARILRWAAARGAVHALGKNVAGPTDGVPGVAPVFYAAIAVTLLNFLLSVCVFPESVHKARRRAAAKLAETTGAPAHEAAAVVLGPKQPSVLRRLFGPLAVFAPSKSLAAADGRTGRDWSLTWLAAGLLCYLLSAGLFQIKYLYAEHVYGWGSEELAYYVSYVGGLRAVNMLFILPWVIARFKPKPTPAVTRAGGAPAPQSIAFDLRLAQGALLLDVLSHTLVALPLTNGSASFAAFTGFSSLAAAVIPSAQSLALNLYNRNPRNVAAGVGVLFGAISFLQALGMMITGPLLFGTVYAATVATFPKAIFVLAAALVVAGLASFLLIRTGAPPASKPTPVRRAKGKGQDKGKGVARPRPVVHERGRSRVVKHVGDRHVAEQGEPCTSAGTSTAVASSSSASSSSAV